MRIRNRLDLDLVIAMLLLVAALAVRTYHLPQIPPGLHSDEAYNGVDVLDILNGQHPIFFERNNGREPLFIYLQAISVALLGTTPFALRLVSAIIGALTVPAVYWCMKEAFEGTRLGGRRVALWTSLFVAFSYWHLNFSRIGYRAIMLPLMIALACGWFWRAWHKLAARRRLPWADLVLCGLFLGLGLYTYTSARFVPFLIIALVLAGLLVGERKLIGLGRGAAALAVIAVVAALVFAPLGAYFVTHPASFLGRADGTSLLNPINNHGNVLHALGRNIVKTAGMFGVAGDINPRHNPAGRPAFDALLSLWLLAGVVWALARWRSLPHLFGLLWLAVLALPALLSDGAPHTLRAIGIIPAACLLPVIAMLETGDWLGCALQRRFAGRARGWTFLRGLYQRLPALGVWLPLPFLLFSGITGVQNYFGAFAHTEAVDYAFDTRFVAAASALEQKVEPQTIWLLPVYPIFNLPHPDTALSFLSHGQLQNTLMIAREDSAPAQLRQLSGTFRQANLLAWPGAGLEPDGSYALVDWKHLIEFLLAKYGRATGEYNAKSVGYKTYTLSSGADYRVEGTITPTDISFGKQVKLTGLDFGVTAGDQHLSGQALESKSIPSGQAMWAVLHWQSEQPVERHLKASLFLTDEAGHLAGQVDDVLAADHYLFERTWQSGAATTSYDILPTLPGIVPGRYRLNLAVYDADTQERLPVVDKDGSVTGAAAPVGEVEITPPTAPAHLAPPSPPPANGSLPAGLALLGFDLPSRTLAPGDTLLVTSYWQAQGRLPADYRLRVALEAAAAPDGSAIAASEDLLGGAAFPTSAWQPGDALRAWNDLVAPATAPGGQYRLVLSLWANGAPSGQVTLGEITVAGRPHQYIAPAVGHALRAQFGSQIALYGYGLDTTDSRAGGTLKLTLYWQALGPGQRSYTVFVHLLNSAGQVVAQKDSAPGEGSLPTSGWVPGEFITDPYTLALPENLPAGSYQVEFGMYDPASGARLPVTQADGQPAGDRVLLPGPIQIATK
jgi:4-amino-4-deoxy-L-arabinose transferase-like glycosyltransferase